MAEDAVPTTDTGSEEALSSWVSDEPEPKGDEKEPEPERKAEPEEEPEEGSEPKAKDKPEAKKDEPPRTYKAKAYGKEVEVPADTVDALAKALGVDPGALVRGAQMFKAGQERAREAAEMERKAKALEERLKANPGAALKEMLGQDGFSKLAIEAVRAMMEEDELRNKNPEELDRRRAAEERDKIKAEAEALQRQRQEQEAAAEQERIGERIGAEIKSALEAGKLPIHPYVVKRLAAHMHDHITAENVDDLSIMDYLPEVLDEIQREHAGFMEDLSGEDFIDRFPKTAEKVRDAFVKKVSRPKPPDKQPERREEKSTGKTKRPMGTQGALDAFVRGG